jgi:CheY-like chemotaxis protein
MVTEKCKKILIVDDDMFVINLLNTAFKKHPEYIVTNASNGQEALEKTKQDQFDLIITDIVMPEKDGIAFINELRETDKLVPVIAISGGGNDQPADDYINFACYFADETLTKPFTQEQLFSAIKLVLDNKAANALNYL